MQNLLQLPIFTFRLAINTSAMNLNKKKDLVQVVYLIIVIFKHFGMIVVKQTFR